MSNESKLNKLSKFMLVSALSVMLVFSTAACNNNADGTNNNNNNGTITDAPAGDEPIMTDDPMDAEDDSTTTP
ncbi:hypothetical protein AB4Z21_25695 [Paenibacillus sp. MCAF20]